MILNLILLPPPPECLVYRYALAHPDSVVLGIEPRPCPCYIHALYQLNFSPKCQHLYLFDLWGMGDVFFYLFLIPVIFIPFFSDSTSCSPDWLQTHCVAEDNLHILEPLVSTSQVLGWQTCNTLLAFQIFSLKTVFWFQLSYIIFLIL